MTATRANTIAALQAVILADAWHLVDRLNTVEICLRCFAKPEERIYLGDMNIPGRFCVDCRAFHRTHAGNRLSGALQQECRTCDITGHIKRSASYVERA